MSWSKDTISTRKAKKGRDVRFDDYHIILLCLTQQWFRELVAALESLSPPHPMGRPRQHSAAVIALLFLCSSICGSQARGELYLKSPGRWHEYRRVLQKVFPDDPLLGAGIRPPTRSVLRHYRKVMDLEYGERLHQILEDSSILFAGVMGLGINHGTLLDPSLDAALYGDGVVIAAMSKFTSDDYALNTVTGEWQQRRHDPDAEVHVTGDKRVVYGNKFAHLSGSTGEPGEHITFGFRPTDTRGEKHESKVAIEMAESVKRRAEGFAAILWDRGIRGIDIHELWNLRLHPFVPVYDKEGMTTEIVPLDNHSVTGIGVQTFANKGAVCVEGVDKSMIPIDPIKLEYHPNKDGKIRAYVTSMIPEGSNCDTRLWGRKIMQRVNSSKKGGLNYGEYVRPIPPGSDRWKRVYGLRSLAESYNSWFKAKLLPGQRARGLGRIRIWVDMIILTLIRNTESLMRYLWRNKNLFPVAT